jgi:hypothetical protein
MGIEPYLTFHRPSVSWTAASTGVITAFKRKPGDGLNLHWLTSSATDTYTISLEGSGWPYRLNLWTGDVEPIAAFSAPSDNYISINISIASGAAEAIFIGKTNPYGARTPPHHVTSIQTAQAVVDNSTNTLQIRATANGTYTAALSDGTTANVTFTSIPAATTLKAWSLAVEDWNPTNVSTIGAGSSATTKTNLTTLALTSLSAWTSLASLANASGIGYYTTSFTAPSLTTTTNATKAAASTTTGVYCTVASVTGTWLLSVNGVQVKNNDLFVTRPIDITAYVKEGTNG